MIVIDYYNFIYHRYAEINESVIFHSLKLLSFFIKDKDIQIKVVFDGVFFQNINFKHKSIKLCFAYGISADDYIIDIFSKLQGKSHIIVSKDKALVNFVKKKSNAKIIFPEIFWKELDFLSHYGNITNKKSQLIKFSDEDSEIDDLFYNYFNEKK